MVRIIFFTVCIFSLLFAEITAKDQIQQSVEVKPINSIADLVEQKLLPAVVNISATSFSHLKSDSHRDEIEKLFEYFFGNKRFETEKPKQEKRNYPLGSGFFISPKGYVVTNYHVVAHAEKVKITTNDGKEFDAEVVGIDDRTDVAVLKVSSLRAFPYVCFGDSKKVRVTDPVIVIGNPFGLGGSVTKGIVSSASRASSTLDFADKSKGNILVKDLIQSDAAANPGNSGGPMFDMNGNVIGITFAITSPSGASAGITFALPSNAVKQVVDELIQKGKIKRGMLGITGMELTKEVAESMGVPNLKGVLIISVQFNSTQAAGLREGDIIIKFDGKLVSNMRELQCLVAEAKLNSTVNIVIIRDKIEKTITVKILSDDDNDNRSRIAYPAYGGIGASNALVLQNLDDFIRKKVGFGPNIGGVIVKEVNQDIGLIKNDIIYNVVGYGNIKDLNEWIKVCYKYKQKGYKLITVLIKNADSQLSRCVSLDINLFSTENKQ